MSRVENGLIPPGADKDFDKLNKKNNSKNEIAVGFFYSKLVLRAYIGNGTHKKQKIK